MKNRNEEAELDLLFEGHPAHVSQNAWADREHNVHQKTCVLKWGESKKSKQAQVHVREEQNQNDNRDWQRGNAKPLLHRDFPSFNFAKSLATANCVSLTISRDATNLKYDI